ncbi:hypothetical protein BECAL_02789 [Bellilinea caldifistulae]|uniref:DUF1684 domain-containing protein n=1 Tax=Bellilinea caldifistulae TaxID=360411 RepID=A0A0P6WVY6_9CHLR|nr:DUF1684 domain-containing protein [Bellilinea caldifistulae]KPL74422.1 hypothetical protein AC812_11370 [Bellilinea caldifistulae]GAP11599.1 hypothetical protein BECAL_02789 [Bellilinea caldifistulae]
MNYATIRHEKDEFFANHPQSPLREEQKVVFSGLNYFPPNPGLRLELTLQPFPERTHVEIQTNTGDIQIYARLGRFSFEVEGQKVELTLYGNQYGYFLPFVDSLAGVETYPAGRYLEPEAIGQNQFIVDFNLAYNPYCAYNDDWSCPLTPPENHLTVPIRAGEKLFHSPSNHK